MKFSPELMHAEIVEQLAIALAHLDADLQLVATVGSWGDTLTDEDVLAVLKDWNKRHK